MISAHEQLAEVLVSLLQREQGSVAHFLADADPYVGPGAPELRRVIRKVADGQCRREAELGELVEDLGGTLRPPAVTPEHQYLSFLAASYLLPKVIESRRASISRYEMALRVAGPSELRVRELLKSHADRLRAELEWLAIACAQTP